MRPLARLAARTLDRWLTRCDVCGARLPRRDLPCHHAVDHADEPQPEETR